MFIQCTSLVVMGMYMPATINSGPGLTSAAGGVVGESCVSVSVDTRVIRMHRTCGPAKQHSSCLSTACNNLPGFAQGWSENKVLGFLKVGFSLTGPVLYTTI